MLLLQDAGGETAFSISLENRHRFLHNDRSMIQFFVYEVHSAACDFHSVGKGLFLSLQPGKCRQERRVNVQNAPRKLLHEPGREQTHVAGQADQIHITLVQRRNHFAVVFLTLFTLGGNQKCLQFHALRYRHP